MKKIYRRVLLELDVPLSNQQIAERTGLSAETVGNTLRNLRERGLVISIGATKARRHMRLAAAIEKLMIDLEDLTRRIEHLEQPDLPLS